MESIFARLDEKRNLQKSFDNIFLRKLRKCIILADFSQNLTNYALILEILRKFSKIFEIFLRKIAKNALF